jgi:hypothetical protein
MIRNTEYKEGITKVTDEVARPGEMIPEPENRGAKTRAELPRYEVPYLEHKHVERQKIVWYQTCNRYNIL